MVASAVIGTAVSFYFNQLPAGIACFLAGVFIDLDHFIDFFAAHSFRNIRSFSKIMLDVNFAKFYVILHSFELIALFWAAVVYFKLGPLWTGIAIGFTQHLLMDQLWNPVYKMTYFLSYRIKCGFDTDRLINMNIVRNMISSREARRTERQRGER